MLRSMMQVYVKGSIEAVELYKKAFNATQVVIMYSLGLYFGELRGVLDRNIDLYYLSTVFDNVPKITKHEHSGSSTVS